LAPSTNYAWHIHHEKLFEPLTEPIENRIKFIESDKPIEQRATRLKLLRPVKDQARLASVLDTGKKVRDSGWKAYDDALTKLASQRKSPDQAVADLASNAVTDLIAAQDAESRAIAALHKRECEADCPWDGKTIFPKVKVAV
jgi:hypothetical protein